MATPVKKTEEDSTSTEALEEAGPETGVDSVPSWAWSHGGNGGSSVTVPVCVSNGGGGRGGFGNTHFGAGNAFLVGCCGCGSIPDSFWQEMSWQG